MVPVRLLVLSHRNIACVVGFGLLPNDDPAGTPLVLLLVHEHSHRGA